MISSAEAGAEELLGVLGNLQTQELIRIDDAAWVRRALDGKAKVEQAVNLVGQGALGGAFWGMLIGLLFLVPRLGAAIGATTGATTGALAVVRPISASTTNSSRRSGIRITPGTSALFWLTDDAVADKVADALKGHDFEIIHTNRPTE